MTLTGCRLGFCMLLAGLAPAGFAAPPPVWQMDPAHSSLSFSYVQEGAPKDGHFATFDATIAFDPADPSTATIVVTIDLASVSAGSKDADDSLKSRDWFNVKLFPQAGFNSVNVRAAGGQAYIMDADLTIRDTSVRVSLPFDLQFDGDQAHATGSLSLDRTAFRLGGGFWDNPGFIGHEVVVRFDLTAKKAP